MVDDTLSGNDPRLQSAMEYLMTYGWSILIVAVVLGALAYLGVFNPLYFAPKANPGSCQVFRPNGAGTSYDINLLGVCNNEVPKYVGQLNGQSSYAYGNGIYAFPFSNFQWIYPTSFGSSNFQVISEFDGNQLSCGGDSPYCGAFQIALMTDGNVVVWNGETNFDSNLQVQLGRWNFVGYSISSTSIAIYVNNQRELFPASTAAPDNGAPIFNIFGYQQCCGNRFFQGSISNVQEYNNTLDWPSVNTIYQEGIGGVPIDLQNLVGWWPLNGNANDYSGNGNNVIPADISFTSGWIDSYNPP